MPFVWLYAWTKAKAHITHTPCFRKEKSNKAYFGSNQKYRSVSYKYKLWMVTSSPTIRWTSSKIKHVFRIERFIDYNNKQEKSARLRVLVFLCVLFGVIVTLACTAYVRLCASNTICWTRTQEKTKIEWMNERCAVCCVTLNWRIGEMKRSLFVEDSRAPCHVIESDWSSTIDMYYPHLVYFAHYYLC